MGNCPLGDQSVPESPSSCGTKSEGPPPQKKNNKQIGPTCYNLGGLDVGMFD